MNKQKITRKKGNNKKKYSSLYYAIIREMETQWPAWKIEAYNEQYATSAHAIKIRSKKIRI